MNNLILGLMAGTLFGFMLQRAEVLRYDKQLAALRFQDMTIVKFMLSFVLTAMIGMYVLHDMGLIQLKVKPLMITHNIVGGILFGLGWGLNGYCPGTSLGALGEGRLDALWGIGGMLVGAGLFAEIYPWTQQGFLALGSYGKITLPQLLSIHHWFLVPVITGLFILLFILLEKKDL